MIVGSLVPVERPTLDEGRLSDITEVALDEITTNPVIDREIRRNTVIMKELRAVVTSALRHKPL